MTTLTIIGRDGCHLCAVASEIVDRVLAELPDAVADGIEVVEVDVDSRADLRSMYTDKVPVVLIDDAVHAYWRLDAGRLREALTEQEEAVR